jgi:TatA/E family protein of Tat protein translocase
MFGLGAGELFLILGICVLFFGPKKIPMLARGMGEAIREFKKSKEDSQAPEKKEV